MKTQLDFGGPGTPPPQKQSLAGGTEGVGEGAKKQKNWGTCRAGGNPRGPTGASEGVGAYPGNTGSPPSRGERGGPSP